MGNRGVLVTLADGQTVRIRPISAVDAIRLIHFHERLSDRTIYLRFLGAHPHLTPTEIEYFTHVDHEQREAYVALQGERIVGVGRWDKASDRSAEVAFVVADDFQHLGLGSVLFSVVTETARENGVRQLFAEMLPSNRGMRHLMETLGEVTEKTVQDGLLHMSVRIPD